MVDMNFGSFIPEEVVTSWVVEINDYEKTWRNLQVARKIFPYRSIGETMDYDSITRYDASGTIAQIIAKGSVPEPYTMKARQSKHEMLCNAAGFTIHDRDLAKPQGALQKNKEIDVGLASMHELEDNLAINGSTSLGITGIVGAARANSNGKIAASAGTYNNNGAWDGNDDNRDIYEDVLLATTLQDVRFAPAFLLGNRLSLSYLKTNDSERHPFYQQISGLFGKSPEDMSWMVESPQVPTGFVYVVPYMPNAGEFVVSTEIDIKEPYREKGGNWWIEMSEWFCPELHEVDAYVEIAIT